METAISKIVDMYQLSGFLEAYTDMTLTLKVTHVALPRRCLA